MPKIEFDGFTYNDATRRPPLALEAIVGVLVSMSENFENSDIMHFIPPAKREEALSIFRAANLIASRDQVFTAHWFGEDGRNLLGLLDMQDGVLALTEMITDDERQRQMLDFMDKVSIEQLQDSHFSEGLFFNIIGALDEANESGKTAPAVVEPMDENGQLVSVGDQVVHFTVTDEDGMPVEMTPDLEQFTKELVHQAVEQNFQGDLTEIAQSIDARLRGKIN